MKVAPAFLPFLLVASRLLLLTASPDAAAADEMTFMTWVGPSTGGGSIDGIGPAAGFNDLHRLAVAGNGTVYVADTGNHTIRKVTSEGEVTTLAGKAGYPGTRTGSAFPPVLQSRSASSWMFTPDVADLFVFRPPTTPEGLPFGR